MKKRKGESRKEFNKRARKYMKERYRRRIDAARKMLGERCVRCGAIWDLHFDHVDPSTKEMLVSKAAYYSEDRFWLEVGKCQLLCVSCHVEKSFEDGSNSPPPKHGQRSRYAAHGCRCKACTKAQREYMREYMEGTGQRG